MATPQSFLADGGEMGKLTRQYNWAQTSLGPMAQWPTSLQITVRNLLHSAFPMFLWWGPELICFYNDAYRPSLGDHGKHPHMLGKPAKAVWSEIWDFISPLIEQVMRTAQSVWYENQLVPIYRNGQLEEVYWTFSYSPAFNEVGQVQGVLVTCIETTPQVNLFNQLRLSEQRFQNLVRDASIAIIVLTGQEMRVSIVNQAYARLIDRGIDELQGHPLFDIIPEAEEPFRAIIQEVRQTGEPLYLYDQPYAIYGEQGKKEGFLNLVYQPFREIDGSITGVMVLCQDVTQQVVSRQAVAESETRFRTLIEQAPVATCLFVGRDLVIEIANEAMITFFGQGPSILNKPIRDVLPNTDADQAAIALLDTVLATGEPYAATGAPASLTIHGRPGTYYFDLSLKPLRNAAGEVYAVLETAVDVTEQEVARRALAESELRLQSIIDLAELGSYSIDVATQRITKSPRVAQWYGLPELTDVATSIHAIQERDRDWIRQVLNDALKPGSTGFYQVEYTVINATTGRQRILRTNGQVKWGASGQAVRIDGTVLDITTQHALQEELERQVQQRTDELWASKQATERANQGLAEANRDLTRSNQNLQQFAYIASHDLQEPLRKIQSFSDILRSQYESQLGDGVEHLHRMQLAASRMSILIRDLLAYSRISTHPDTTVPVSLTTVVRTTVDDLDLLIAETGAIVRIDELPTILGDPSQLGQLFQNLLSNAVKFRRTNTAPHIEVRCQLVPASALPTSPQPTRQTTDYYLIEVVDNGIGFDDRYTNRIFQVFQRLHGKNEYAGSGIGLAICEKVVANHGGAIWARSQPGQGATFSIYFPYP
ncbi:PAS domain-containing protein [Spirosoma sp.]|uniref:PAS domain-containing protein n=1 Tax=Spirosoma sp. TaxID=1899569 RepID=UPI0026204443|nr:PAS domain-containing protein [Spirosoma sp.]MCX6212874.1 PAS domain-containing protein [Spirosoma sp.]